MAINSYPEIEVDKLPTPGDDMPGVKDIIASGYITDKYDHSGTLAAGLYKVAVNSEYYVGIGATFIFADNNITISLNGIDNKETSVRLTTSESNFSILAGWQNANIALGLSTQTRFMSYGNGYYMTITYGTTSNANLRKSKDGINWSTIPGGTSLGWSTSFQHQTLKYVNDRWIVIGAGVGAVSQSTNNGITWTTLSPTTTTQTIFYDSAYGNGNYVLTAGNQNSVSASHSTDLISWTTKSLGQAQLGIIYAEGLFVTVSTAPAIYTSTDGVTWTSRTVPSGVTGLRDIVHDGSKFFSYGTGNSGNAANIIIQSTDGITWSTIETPFSIDDDANRLACNTSGNKYYAIPEDARMLWYTTDITTSTSWAKVDPSNLQLPNSSTSFEQDISALRGVSFANGKFFVNINNPGTAVTGQFYPNNSRGVAFTPTDTAVEFYVYTTDLELKNN